MDLVHTLSRGVDKRDIFIDEQDYFRFVHDLFEFNDQESADNIFIFSIKLNLTTSQVVILRKRGSRESFWLPFMRFV